MQPYTHAIPYPDYFQNKTFSSVLFDLKSRCCSLVDVMLIFSSRYLTVAIEKCINSGLRAQQYHAVADQVGPYAPPPPPLACVAPL